MRAARRDHRIAGCGKSTLARQLSVALKLSLFHMDQLKWLPGWVEGSPEHLQTRLAGIVSGDRWLIDGNYAGTLDMRLARSEAVIWLDLPTWRCMWGVVRRIVTHYGRTRADMTPGCPERFDLMFMIYVWRFRRDGRPILVEKLKRFESLVIRLSSHGDVAALLAALR